MTHFFASVVLCVAAAAVCAQEPADKCEELFAQGKYREALAVANQRLERDPTNKVVLYNAGLAAYLGGEYKSAVALWLRLKELDTNDWRVLAKLVQAYEAAGIAQSRDKMIKELYELRSANTNSDLAQQAFFCRDQFEHKKKKVMVFEHYALVGDRAVKWKFMVLKDDGDEDYVVSLGSYEATNEVSRELGELKKGQRLYHLDGYYNGGASHRTYGFYEGQPSYDAIKQQVKKVIEGSLDAVSGCDVTRDGSDKEKP